MNAVSGFIKAAAPYASAGTALAFFAVRAAVRKKKGGERDGSCSLEGMCFGLLFGTALVFCLVCLSVLQSGRVFKKVLTSNRSVAIIEVTERLQKTLGVKLWQEIQRNAF